MSSEKPTINVVAAVISRQSEAGEQEFLVARRGHGDLKGLYEFPGGKIEKGEEAVDAVQREIREELKAEVIVSGSVAAIEFDYPKFHLNLQAFHCNLISDAIILTEHQDAQWINPKKFSEIPFAPADRMLAGIIAEREDMTNEEKRNY